MNKNSKPIPQHLSDFLDWLDIEKGLSAKSQENYARFLKKFMDWLRGQKLDQLKPHELTSEHVWNYRVFLARRAMPHSEQPLEKSTQNYYLIALRSLLNFFADRDIISLPSEKVKLARNKDEKKVRFLTLEQVEKLCSIPDIKKQDGLRERAILELLFSTGMRISELVALNRKQIIGRHDAPDLELAIIGKGSVARTVYISERALGWTKKYLATRADDFEPLFINSRTNDPEQRRLSPRTIQKTIKRMAMIAGLPANTTPHVMRHSFATDLLEHGVDIRTIQEFLGHKQIAATQIYTHVTSSKLRKVHREFHGKKM